MILFGTGHRPPKIGGYGEKAAGERTGLAMAALHILKPEMVISGMALGWDTDLAMAALALGIPVTAAVPFAGQERQWPSESQKIFNDILNKCYQVVTVSEGGYSASKMQIRNTFMVDNATHGIALFDGTPGGTANCMKYAIAKGKPVLNLWDAFSGERRVRDLAEEFML